MEVGEVSAGPSPAPVLRIFASGPRDDVPGGEQLGDSPGSRSLDFVISKIEIRGPNTSLCVGRISETVGDSAQQNAQRGGDTL